MIFSRLLGMLSFLLDVGLLPSGGCTQVKWQSPWLYHRVRHTI